MSLNTPDIETLKARLHARQNLIEQNLDEHKHKFSEQGHLDRGGIDGGDESNQELQTQLNLGQVDRETNELRLIKQALDKIATHAYGTCEVCGDPINKERLFSNPIAKRCLDCQSHRENDFDERDSTPSL